MHSKEPMKRHSYQQPLLINVLQLYPL